MSERARITTKTPDVKNENTVSKARKPDFSRSITSPVDHLLFLQRTIGNQAVQRLVKSGALRAKLKIGRSGDRYEQEADRVADTVMRMPGPQVQRRPEKEEGEEPIQAKEVSGRTPNVTLNMEIRLNALQGSGQPLQEADRRFMEKRFGSDFSGIRVHTDSEAVQMSRELNAQAFTNGRDIFFGAGRYSPKTSSGKKLLAHELTHVVQQSAGSNNVTKENRGNIRCQTPPTVKDRKYTPPPLRIPIPSMPTITLPHIRIEAIPETIRRLLSEFRGHVDAGDIEKAKALVPKIKTYVMGTSMAWNFGILAAKAFLSIGMTKDAFEVLEDARKQHIWGHHRTKFSRNVARELLKEGKATLARKDPETAYTIFIKLFRWLEKPELQKSMSTIMEVFGGELFLKEMYRDAVASLTSVVDYYLIRAEDAYKSKDSKAPILLAKAKAVLDRLKKDLKDVPGLKVVVAEPKLTKPGSKTAEYVDIYDPKRVKMKVKQYPGADFPNYFSDRIRRIETILKSKAAQISSVKGFYESDKAVVTLYEKRYGKRPDIHKLTDRRKFWSLKYDFLVGAGKTRQEALQALMDSIGGYLKGFTIHSKYDIPDARADVLTAKFPKATTRQAIMDCGVFAIRTAYELSLIRKKTSMDFYYVFMPIHVGLGIIDKGKTFGWALHNNQISLIKKDINKEGVARAVGFYFGYAPAPAEASKLKGLSGKALRRALISKSGGLFVPPNLAKLRGTAKKEAIAKGKELKNRYNSLKGQHMRLVRKSTYHLINLRDRHKERGKIKPGEYKKFAVKLIEPLYTTYVNISEKVTKFYFDLRAFRGVKTITPSISGYYQNTYYMLRYLAYVLGKEEFKTKKYVDKPIFAPAELDYEGDPPPWKKGVYDFAED